MADLLVQVGQGSEWELCRLFHMNHGGNHYVRVVIESGDCVTFYGLREALASKLRALLALIETSAAPEPAAVAGLITQRDVTPLETIEKFQNSPILNPMAGDVETAMAGLVSDVDRIKEHTTLADLFDDSGQPVRGAQARIAEALGLENAGAYRRRILQALKTLQREYSTTIEKSPPERAKTA